MESLELSEASSSSSTETDDSPRKMSLRKRISSPIAEKRRVITKPIKRLNGNSSVDIKQIYLCRKIKKLAPNLETIFEEPKTTKDNELQLTSLRKEKRFLVFEQNKKGKIKKRQVKIKRVFNKNNLKKKHMSMDLLLKKLGSIE